MNTSTEEFRKRISYFVTDIEQAEELERPPFMLPAGIIPAIIQSKEVRQEFGVFPVFDQRVWALGITGLHTTLRDNILPLSVALALGERDTSSLTRVLSILVPDASIRLERNAVFIHKSRRLTADETDTAVKWTRDPSDQSLFRQVISRSPEEIQDLEQKVGEWLDRGVLRPEDFGSMPKERPS